MIREPMTATAPEGSESGGPATLPVALVYDERDPFAVTLEIECEVTIVWTFARDLLLLGSHTAKEYGDGDVRICTHPTGVVSVLLSSPDGELRLSLPGEPVRHFLRRSLTAIPRGTEYVDLDALVERLVGA